jgi:hypothetical protein
MPLSDQVTSAAEAMEAYILHNGGVSLVELERVAGEHIETKGELAWVADDDPNLLFWAGVSREFMNALDDVRERGKVEPAPSNFLVYLIDGKALRYPLAKRPPKRGYKEEHWIPVVFNAKVAKGG